MALSFDSGNPRVLLGSLAGLSEATAMTIATWIKLNSTGTDATIAIRGTTFATSAPWLLWRDDAASVSGRTNTLSAVVNTDIGVLRIEGASNLLNDTTNWHHVAMVFEAGAADGMRLYVDGVRDANVASTIGHTNIVADTSDATVGIDDATRAFLGQMAELSFWSDALTDRDVAQLSSGFTPLAIAGAINRLAVYQDLVRGANRPGVGPVVSTAGTLSPAPHPRVLPPHAVLSHTSSIRPLLAGPYRSAGGELQMHAGEAGDVFIPGADYGALTPIGEVNG